MPASALASQVLADALREFRDTSRVTLTDSWPVDQQVVALAPRQHMHVNVPDRLPDDRAIGLNEAKPAGTTLVSPLHQFALTNALRVEC